MKLFADFCGIVFVDDVLSLPFEVIGYVQIRVFYHGSVPEGSGESHKSCNRSWKSFYKSQNLITFRIFTV